MLIAVQGDTSDVSRMIDYLAGISFDSPRGPFNLDSQSQNPSQHIYVRRVDEVDGALHNVVIEDLGALRIQVDPFAARSRTLSQYW